MVRPTTETLDKGEGRGDEVEPVLTGENPRLPEGSGRRRLGLDGIDEDNPDAR